jgi:dTDP-4-dehydrorhamnose reductase
LGTPGHEAGLAGKTIVITGAGGMLGRAFAEAAADHPQARIIALARTELDVTDRRGVMGLAETSPDVVIHCAADVNADRCEANPDACRAVQVGGTRNVIDLCRRTGAVLMYPQSFLIFDGSSLPITEATPPAPLSVYGRCKLEAETAIRDELPRHLVVRMAGFFGGDEADKNFVGKFARHLRTLLREGATSFDVGDRVWQPTYTLDLARNCLALLARGRTGVYGMASHGEASFFDLAQASVEILGLSSRIEIRKVSAAVVTRAEPAKRPARAVIDNVRLRAEGLDMQRGWRQALAEYLARPYFRALFA